MNRNNRPQGLALVLIWVGVVLAVVGSLGSMVFDGGPRMQTLTAIGAVLLTVGWMVHGRSGARR